MRKIEYYLLPEAGYSGEYDRKEGHYLIKIGTIADLLHDSKILWGYDYDKKIPAMTELNDVLKAGEYPRLAEWDPIEVQEDEYLEIVQALVEIPLARPYRI